MKMNPKKPSKRPNRSSASALDTPQSGLTANDCRQIPKMSLCEVRALLMRKIPAVFSMTPLFAARVMTAKPGAKAWITRGGHCFQTMPRIGEHLDLVGKDGLGIPCRIVDVRHPATPTGEGVDIYAIEETAQNPAHSLVQSILAPLRNESKS
jgi:hypothetical protein